MRISAFILLILLSLTSSTYAQTDTQKNTIFNLHMIVALEESCPKWKTNEVLVAYALAYNKMTFSDLLNGGKFYEESRRAVISSTNMLQKLDKDLHCGLAELSYGPNGQQAAHMMIRR